MGDITKIVQNIAKELEPIHPCSDYELGRLAEILSAHYTVPVDMATRVNLWCCEMKMPELCSVAHRGIK